MHHLDSTIIVGSVVSLVAPTTAPLQARLKAAWCSYAKLRGQLRQRSVTVKARVPFAGDDMFTNIALGTESVDFTSLQRHRLTATQRRTLADLLHAPRRSEDNLTDYCRRQERIVTVTIQKHCRAVWGEVPRYRFYSFLGHNARLSPSTHMCSIVSFWRSSDWWQEYSTRLPDKQKRQPGRRAPHRGRPMPMERSIDEDFKTLQKARFFPRIQQKCFGENQRMPRTWRILAQCCEAYRAFARWCAFKRKLWSMKRHEFC